MQLPSVNSSDLSADRPSVPGRIHGGDWFWIALAVSILLAGSLLQVVGADHVSFIGNSQLQLPQLCYSRSWFGIECPGCGMTRSIIHLVHGRLAESWSAHHLGWLVLLVILAQVPYRLWIPWQKRASEPRWGRYELRLWAGLGILLILNRIWGVFG